MCADPWRRRKSSVTRVTSPCCTTTTSSSGPSWRARRTGGQAHGRWNHGLLHVVRVPPSRSPSRSQSALQERNEQAATQLNVSIGISAGEPVTDDNNDLFGAAVQLAARLCAAAQAGDISVSIAVRELCMGKQFRFEDRGTDPAWKGLSEPAHTYAVIWHD